MTRKQAYQWLAQPGVKATLYHYDRQTNEALRVAIEALSADPCEDTISRQEIKDWVERYEEEEYVHPGYVRSEHILKQIEDMPSAQPERTGRWIDITKTGGDFIWKCSECGELNLEDTYYCPNCGCKMEVEHNG